MVLQGRGKQQKWEKSVYFAFHVGKYLRLKKKPSHSEQSGKILQKWVRSSYNRLLHGKCFCFFHLFLSSFMTECLSDTIPCCLSKLCPQVPKYLFLGGCFTAADQHSAAWSNLHLSFLSHSPALPSSSPSTLTPSHSILIKVLS